MYQVEKCRTACDITSSATVLGSAANASIDEAFSIAAMSSADCATFENKGMLVSKQLRLIAYIPSITARPLD